MNERDMSLTYITFLDSRRHLLQGRPAGAVGGVLAALVALRVVVLHRCVASFQCVLLHEKPFQSTAKKIEKQKNQSPYRKDISHSIETTKKFNLWYPSTSLLRIRTDFLSITRSLSGDLFFVSLCPSFRPSVL